MSLNQKSKNDLSNYNKFKEKYFNFWTTFFDIKKRVKLWHVDFDEPWWIFYWRYKFKILPTFIYEILLSFFWVFLPLVIAYSFENKVYNFLMFALSFRIFLVFAGYLVNHFWIIFVENVEGSYSYELNKFFFLFLFFLNYFYLVLILFIK
jgi:hypothetical protein